MAAITEISMPIPPVFWQTILPEPSLDFYGSQPTQFFMLRSSSHNFWPYKPKVSGRIQRHQFAIEIQVAVIAMADPFQG